MVHDAEMIFDLTKFPWLESHHQPDVQGEFGEALLLKLWHALGRNDKRCSDRGGYIGLAAASVFPDGPVPRREEIGPKFENVISPAVIGLFLLQPERETEMFTGHTVFGQYMIVLTRDKNVDNLRFNVTLFRHKLRDQLVKKEEAERKKRIVPKRETDPAIAAVFFNLPKPPADRIAALEDINRQFRDEFARQYGEWFNAELRNMLANNPPEDYEGKKSVVAWVKEKLDAHNLAIRQPDDEGPCNLITLAGYDSKGVFVLESRHDRRRSHTTNDLESILDLTLMDGGPRVTTGRRTGRS